MAKALPLGMPSVKALAAASATAADRTALLLFEITDFPSGVASLTERCAIHARRATHPYSSTSWETHQKGDDGK
ncbi:hypothetical protein GCM10023336_38560 [Streptomyces similanensis]|uniref:Uncharacterized protein n=1 Tax=Streptomyces similanensis TaxID=1274988 RepID=A0ABP9KLH9_9ACTN